MTNIPGDRSTDNYVDSVGFCRQYLLVVEGSGSFLQGICDSEEYMDRDRKTSLWEYRSAV